MAMNFSECRASSSGEPVILGGAVVTAALYFTVFKSQNDKNTAAQHALEDKIRENNELESYRPKLKQMEQQLAELKQQLEIEQRIVPDEKQVDTFITMLDGEAQKAGVELRRYTAKDTKSQQYYTEVPFDLELDGPYYSALNFFDRVSKLERIVNISGLLVATTKNPSGAKAKRTYQYAPNESVVATFTATTYFSHDLQPSAAGAGAKPANAGGEVGMAMKLTLGILATAMMVSGAWAQSPDAIDNARSTAKSLQQKQDNAASKAAAVPATAKPAPGAPAPAVKPAVIPGATPVAAKPAPATSSHNQLQKVNVVPEADGVQIEISSSHAVTPQVTKLTSPDRLLVELPETVVATAQNKIPVGSAGVKGVRIGMDGKTPPTTSVVVDLNSPLAYELTPGAAGKLILTLHSQGGAPSVAKNSRCASRKGVGTGGEDICANGSGVGQTSSSPREGCGGESSGGEASGSGYETGPQTGCQGCPSAEGSGPRLQPWRNRQRLPPRAPRIPSNPSRKRRSGR